MEAVNAPVAHAPGSPVRLLPFAGADGPDNMAADEALLHTAAHDGRASLRFYTWTPPTLSLGYFQPSAARTAEPSLAQLPWVRRPSGGATLVHHHELTYCLTLPAGTPWQSGEPWLSRMHRIIAEALGALGGRAALVEQPQILGEVLCFQRQTPGDLVCAGAKIVGSAQRKHRQALLQHGSILLARSPFTSQLPGIRELTGVALTPEDVGHAVAAAFVTRTGWTLANDDWTAEERRQVETFSATKYRTAAWNERR